jgi:SAM-dependent methyltransferase
MNEAVEEFYDGFSRRFIRDYVRGNRRVERQVAFLAAAIPRATTRALVIGCGTGEAARCIAARIAPSSHVLAVDISGENLRLARLLHPHPRVTYAQLDVLTATLDGCFDVIVLPDVYEHIPVQMRGVLHERLNRVLAADGRVLLTVPSPGTQAALADAGEARQIVDEVVTTADLVTLARDVGGDVTYLNRISVWQAHDYVHAAITRGSQQVAPLSASTPLQLYGATTTTLGGRLLRAAVRYVMLRIKLARS